MNVCLILCTMSSSWKSSGFMLASQATNQGCLVVLACFTTASIQASFLPRPSFRMSENYHKNPHTSSHIHPCLGDSLTSWDRCDLIATNTPSDVCFRSSLPALSSMIRAASAAFLHPCLDRFRRRCRKYLCTFSKSSFPCTTKSHSTGYTSPFSAISASHFCFSCFLMFGQTVSHHFLLPSNLFHLSFSFLVVIQRAHQPPQHFCIPSR